MKIIVDVAGYNYSVRNLDEVVKTFHLNPIQVHLLKQGKQLTVKGDVTLEPVFSSEVT